MQVLVTERNDGKQLTFDSILVGSKPDVATIN